MAAVAKRIDDAALLQQLEVAADHWRALDWGMTLQGIDGTLQQSKEAKELSLSARKTLADTTKQFKKSVKTVEMTVATLTPETIPVTVKAVDTLAKECKVTVKSYQEEIDSLTRRCKTAENAYSALGQALAGLPDPAALLAAALQHVSMQQSQLNQLLSTVEEVNSELQAQEQMNHAYKKEIQALKAIKTDSGSNTSTGLSKEEREELIQLRREVAEYEVEFRSLKNQDITIRKLEAKIHEMQVAAQEELQSQLEKMQDELRETEGRRAVEALEREAAAEAKVASLELQLRAERAGREATQAHLLEADEGVSQLEAAWEAQRQILVDDANRMRETLQAAVRERDDLRLKLAAVGDHRKQQGHGKTPPPSGGASMLQDWLLERKAYEAEVAELSETNTLLREELRSKEEAFADEKRSFQSKIDTLERNNSNLTSEVGVLQQQLSAAPSVALVESMKRELRILKRLEYNADDVDAERDPEIAGGNRQDEEKDLETVLVSKLRRAESELVTERTSKTDLVNEVDTLRKKISQMEKEQADADKLIDKLEKDLERAIATATPGTPIRNKPPSSMYLAEENPATLQNILDPSESLPPPPKSDPPKATMRAAEKAEDDHSVATIVMAQRDRLRARCEALEAERDSFKRELQVQVQASESLKADNTKLYEKVRYLQSYNKAPNSRGFNRTISSGMDRDLDLEALEQRYEASVDPFRQFSKAERQRKLNEMSPMERTVFIVAKTVLATREMRTGLFFYVLALHLLVFVTTYHWSHANECTFNNEHLSHLPPQLPAHIQEQMAAQVQQTEKSGKGP